MMSAEPDASATDLPIEVESPRFGAISYTQSEIIRFPWGLPGFTSLRNWLALTLESQPSYIWLQSLDDLKVAIPTANPYHLFEDYDPKLPSYAAAALDIHSPSDFTLLSVLVVTAAAAEMTINLMAPIVINVHTWRARQVLLENSAYSVRTPVPRKAVQEEAASSAI